MKQYYMFLLNAIMIFVLELVDSSFANNISVDSICAMSAYVSVYMFCGIFSTLGKYAYSALQKDADRCFTLNLITSGVIGIIFIVFSNNISQMFELTVNQHRLLRWCLIYKGVSIVFAKMEEFYATYIMYDGRAKEMLIGNVFFYATMIGFDAIVYFSGGECYHLIIATGLADIVTVAYYIFGCKIRLKVGDIKGSLKLIGVGMQLASSAVCTKLAGMICNVIISRLGTTTFAIIGICSNIALTSNEIIAVVGDFIIMRLKVLTKKVNKYAMYKNLVKFLFVPSMLAYLPIFFAVGWFMKGDIRYIDLLPHLILWSLNGVVGYFYSCVRGLNISFGNIKAQAVCGFFSFFIRVPLAFVGLYWIYAVDLSVTLVTIMRYIYLNRCVKNILDREMVSE